MEKKGGHGSGVKLQCTVYSADYNDRL